MLYLCSMNKLDNQRVYRINNNNACTKRYEKTKKGFLMRMYRNMKSRVTGVQKQKAHLYLGKHLLDKDVFYNWAFNQVEFHRLFKNYEDSGYDRKLAPTVDRIDSLMGYLIDNMEFVTHSENSRRGGIGYGKLKEHKEEIISLIKGGKLKDSEIARKFNVSQSAIYYINKKILEGEVI